MNYTIVSRNIFLITQKNKFIKKGATDKRLDLHFWLCSPLEEVWTVPLLKVKVFPSTLTFPLLKWGPSTFPSLHNFVNSWTGFKGSLHWLYPQLDNRKKNEHIRTLFLFLRAWFRWTKKSALLMLLLVLILWTLSLLAYLLRLVPYLFMICILHLLYNVALVGNI